MAQEMQLEGYATSTNVLNYSGMLFNKGNTRTPLSSIIGSKAKITNHIEFVTGQEYTTVGGDGSYNAISEEASLEAPKETCIKRTQETNVTQIFHETVGVSYVKQSNMGTLAKLNIANQQANPISELDFQVAAKIQKINRDIEYAFINSEFHKEAYKNTNDKIIGHSTRGLIHAITSNVKNMNGKPVGLWDIAELVKIIYGNNAPTEGLCLWCDATTLFQVNADAVQNGLTVVPAAREINGIALSSVVTPIGVVYLYLGECLPPGIALLLNLDVISPVHQPVPGKGNFFLEPLAKDGAGERYQLFGQIGLDHGPEWYHGKFTFVNSKFKTPTYSRSVYVSNANDMSELSANNIKSFKEALDILNTASIKDTLKIRDALKEKFNAVIQETDASKQPTAIKAFQDELNKYIKDASNNVIIQAMLLCIFKDFGDTSPEDAKLTAFYNLLNQGCDEHNKKILDCVLQELNNNTKNAKFKGTINGLFKDGSFK